MHWWLLSVGMIADRFNVSSSNVVLNSGGNYNNTNRNYGPFYFNGNSVTNSNSNLGARFLAF